MTEEKKYPVGSEGLYNSNDLPTLASMRAEIKSMREDIYILKGALERLQNCVIPVIEELQDFSLKISNPVIIRKVTKAAKPPHA